MNCFVATHQHQKERFVNTAYSRSIVDAQEKLDEKHNKKGYPRKVIHIEFYALRKYLENRGGGKQ